MRPILNYHGGKFMMRKFIIEKMQKHEIYVEPFGGGASVLLSKAPVRIEVYNDLDSEIVNVFNVAKFHGQELIRRLKLTPYSRELYLDARPRVNCPIGQAVNTIVKSFMGIGDSIHNGTGFRNSKTSSTSPAVSFKNYADFFDFFIERLRGVIIESLHYSEILKKYDSEKTLFYLDPPYIASTRSKLNAYGHEMTDLDHVEMVEKIQLLKGSVLLSGYENEFYNRLSWARYTKNVSTQKLSRQEILWVK